MARAKKLLVSGTHYVVQVSWGEQKRLNEEFLAMRDADEDNEQELGDFLEAAVRAHVKQVEDETGVLVDVTDDNFGDLMTGQDLVQIGLYLVNAQGAVQVVGAVPFVGSVSSPHSSPQDDV